MVRWPMSKTGFVCNGRYFVTLGSLVGVVLPSVEKVV